MHTLSPLRCIETDVTALCVCLYQVRLGSRGVCAK